MTTIEELARTTAASHGIDSHAAALDVVRVHVDQIADDSDLYNAETEQLTDDGAEVVATAIAESYAQGLHATRACDLLDEIAREATAISEADQAIKDHTAERNALIRAALRTELPRTDIAAAARVKEARLYQIRDGRR